MNIEKLVYSALALAVVIAVPLSIIENKPTEADLLREDLKNAQEIIEIKDTEIKKLEKDLQAKAKKIEKEKLAIATGGCERYQKILAKYDWDVNMASAIMRAESGCNPLAANYNDSHATCRGSFGLFQLGCFWTDKPFDAEHNIAKAYEIYSRSGWNPWGAYTNGSYKKFL